MKPLGKYFFVPTWSGCRFAENNSLSCQSAFDAKPKLMLTCLPEVFVAFHVPWWKCSEPKWQSSVSMHERRCCKFLPLEAADVLCLRTCGRATFISLEAGRSVGWKDPFCPPFGQRGSFCILRWLCIVGSKILVAFRRIGLSARLQQVFVDDVAFGKLDRTCWSCRSLRSVSWKTWKRMRGLKAWLFMSMLTMLCMNQRREFWEYTQEYICIAPQSQWCQVVNLGTMLRYERSWRDLPEYPSAFVEVLPGMLGKN